MIKSDANCRLSCMDPRCFDVFICEELACYTVARELILSKS